MPWQLKLTGLWYFKKIAIRYECVRNIAYASSKFISSLAESLTSLNYPLSKHLIVEMISLKRFFRRKSRSWSIVDLYDVNLIQPGFKLSEDSILASSKFFEEQEICEPVTEVMIRVPPKPDWKMLNASYLNGREQQV